MLQRQLVTRYEAQVRSGVLEEEAAQKRVVLRLGALADHLALPRHTGVASQWRRLIGKNGGSVPVRGVYLWGPVGRGKTMLMDMFFDIAPSEPKRRVHFNAFMLDAHARIHAWRQSRKAGAVTGDDPIAPVAAELAREASLLCFDEFAVTDIADAMLLGRLFSALFAHGVVVVATSNVAPERLYENGLNRALFLPFIQLLREYMEVVELDAPTDFRYEKTQDASAYFVPADAVAKARLDRAFKRLTGQAHGEPVRLELLGRELVVPEAVDGVARFGFADLCEKPLGAADFLAIGRAFPTVFIDAIPVFPEDQRNLVKRFITLIDTFYDLHVKLIVSAAAEPSELFKASDGTEWFEFARTASRLIEMRSSAYLEAHTSRTAASEAASDPLLP